MEINSLSRFSSTKTGSRSSLGITGTSTIRERRKLNNALKKAQTDMAAITSGPPNVAFL